MKIELIIPDTISWNGPSRKQVFVKRLQEAGHRVECIPRAKGSRYPKCVKSPDVELVVNHTMAIPAASLESTIKQHSATNFIFMNHSSLGDLHTKPHNSDLVTSSIWAARRHGNAWYCTHEKTAAEALVELGLPRCASLPIAMNVLPPGAQPRVMNDKPVLVVAGRCIPVKNLLAQMHVCALASQRGWEIVVSGELDSSCKNMLHALQVKYQHLGLQPFHKWEELLRNRAHAVLQMSYAESFCITALDAMQCGVPVITCGSIRFADPALVVPSSEPSRAGRVLEALRNPGFYRERSVIAAERASEAVAWQNAAYLGSLGYIGSKCSGRVKEICRRAFLFENPTIAEVGVRMGTTCKAVSGFHPNADYHAIDNWSEGNHREEIPSGVQFHEMDSREAADKLESLFDIVFIDADHSYEATRDDIAAWLPKVRPGGWLGGHDYDHPNYPGVKQAVDELKAGGCPVVLGENYTWWVRF